MKQRLVFLYGRVHCPAAAEAFSAGGVFTFDGQVNVDTEVFRGPIVPEMMSWPIAPTRTRRAEIVASLGREREVCMEHTGMFYGFSRLKCYI